MDSRFAKDSLEKKYRLMNHEMEEVKRAYKQI
jgi:hypothetical protein